MAPRARVSPFSVVTVTIAVLTAVLASPTSYYSYSQPSLKIYVRYPTLYRVTTYRYNPVPVYYYVDCDDSDPGPPVPGGPGENGILQQLLTDIYVALSKLLAAIRKDKGLLGELGLVSEILDDVDELLLQVLVSQEYPCSYYNNLGVLPEAFNAIYKLLNSVLASPPNSRHPGIAPDILDSITNLLNRLLSIRPPPGGPGGRNGVGTVAQLLNALDYLLKELFYSQQNKCTGSNYSNGPGSSGGIGVVPKILTELYYAIHKLLEGLGAVDQTGLLQDIGIAPDLLGPIDELLKQLLVAYQYPCDDENYQKGIPQLLNELYKLLESLLSTHRGGGTGSPLTGIIAQLLDDVVALLEKLLGSQGGSGGSAKPGTVDELLDALLRLLRELLVSQRAKCGGGSGGHPPPPPPPTKPHGGEYPHGGHGKPGGSGGRPGQIGVLPQLVNQIYVLIHRLIKALREETVLLGKLGIVSDVLESIDELLLQLLVAQTYPCDNDNYQRLVPQIFNELYYVLDTLLSDKDTVGNLGLISQILNAVTKLLEDLLGSESKDPATTSQLLNALTQLLRDLLLTQRETCDSGPGKPSQPDHGHGGHENVGYYYQYYYVGTYPHGYYVYYPYKYTAPTDSRGADLVGSLQNLLRAVIASRGIGGANPNDVPKYIQSLCAYITDMIDNYCAETGGREGEIQALLNDLADVVEQLVASGGYPRYPYGTYQGPTNQLLKYLQRLLHELLISDPKQPGVVPKALEAVANFLERLL